jgi:hypothetical protein
LGDTPILLLIFNRPEITQCSFNRLREFKPKFLFIAADGPRPNNEKDKIKCQETRKIFDLIDWDCDIKRLYREKNLGCKVAVSSAITWFFEHVEQGIILEDDCIPEPYFFSYAESLLDIYKHDEKIMHIGGNNFQSKIINKDLGYYFSMYNHCWGWATWRRAWCSYCKDFESLNIKNTNKILNYYNATLKEKMYWNTVFKLASHDIYNSWAVRWTYSVWKNKGYAIVPSINLVNNLGFGIESTHTKNDDNRFLMLNEKAEITNLLKSEIIQQKEV